MSSEFCFDTIFFVDGLPVGYKIFKEGAEYVLIPKERSEYLDTMPSLSARFKDGWKVEGTEDQNLIDQVMEDMELFVDKYVE